MKNLSVLFRVGFLFLILHIFALNLLVMGFLQVWLKPGILLDSAYLMALVCLIVAIFCFITSLFSSPNPADHK